MRSLLIIICCFAIIAGLSQFGLWLGIIYETGPLVVGGVTTMLLWSLFEIGEQLRRARADVP